MADHKEEQVQRALAGMDALMRKEHNSKAFQHHNAELKRQQSNQNTTQQ